MSDLFTGESLKQIKWIIVKYLTQCVCLNLFSVTKCTPNQHKKTTAQCLIFIAQIMKQPKWILVK